MTSLLATQHPPRYLIKVIYNQNGVITRPSDIAKGDVVVVIGFFPLYDVP